MNVRNLAHASNRGGRNPQLLTLAERDMEPGEHAGDHARRAGAGDLDVKRPAERVCLGHNLADCALATQVQRL